jgi:tRNA dimethylallyltransferase
LIDVLDPWESASVAEYRRCAIAVVEQIEGRGKQVLFVGGTPLYLKVLLRGLFEGPGALLEFRSGLEAEADQAGTVALHNRLATLDALTAERVHPNYRRRIIRALEVIAATGRPLSAFQTKHDQPAAGAKVIALERPRPELHARINARVDAMFEHGFIDEVRELQSGSRPLGAVAAQGVGYKEVIAHLAGQATLAQTIERIQGRTRQFAKRQCTWFRGLAEVQSWPVPSDEPPRRTAERLAKFWS